MIYYHGSILTGGTLDDMRIAAPKPSFAENEMNELSGGNLRCKRRKLMTGAYSFVWNEGSTEKLCARLNALGGWKWSIGDSYWYGDYARRNPFPGVKLRIV